MSFENNASPFGLGRSREAQDFARRAANNIMPWIKQHYHIYVATRDGANVFTPAGLYNYHLRGDYYLGLTKSNANYDNMNLNSGAAQPRLAHIAETARAFDATLDESINLVTPIGTTPRFPGAQEYGLLGASEPLAPVDAAHFFAREVASGSTLTELLFAEQATMTYRLLPYMDNFHQGVRNFLVSEAMHFIDNIGRLRNRGGPNFNNTNNVHHAFWLGGLEGAPFGFFDWGSDLDNVTRTLPGFTTAAVGLINIPGVPNVDLTGAANFTTQFATLADPSPTFVLPIYYALTAYEEYTRLIRPDLQLDMQDALDGIFTNLFIEAVRTSYRLGGHYTIVGRAANLDNTRFFTRRAYNGELCSIQSDDFNFNSVRDGLRDFFNVYFNLVDSAFPVGTIVRLNTGPINGNTRNAYNHAQSNQTTVPALGNAAFQLHLDGGDLFRITGQNTPVTARNRPNISRYQMESVDDLGIPRGVAVENVQEFYRTDAGEVPGIILYRAPDQGTNNQAAHTPLNIVGRLLLSASYTVFNAGSYYTTQRDMRKLTKDDAPGHYPPLNEAMRSQPANPARPFNHGRRGHQRNTQGVLDMYAEQRADLIADYLAAMYDSLKGKYRDDFVNFYTGDFHTNELAYYTSAVSNYISNFTAPEDANRDEVLVGPRLTTRAPAGLERASAGPGAEAELVHFRTADPELIYYQLDSPLLREVLRQLTTSFYEWYVTLAEQLDRGERNLLRAGLLEGDDPAQRALMVVGSGNNKDPAQDRQRIRPTKLILQSMWPLLTKRAETAVESGEVPAHEMMRRIAIAVGRHRETTSQAIPAIPITTSFINFGELLRSPGQYAFPPRLDSKEVVGFLGYLESTYYNDYGLIGFLAAEIEDVRTMLYTQGQLISAFERQYQSYRTTKVLNRFTFPATANLVTAFRDLIATDPDARAAAAITTTEVPPDPVETPAQSPPLAEPFRRP
jgi:hypothetical protein